MLVVEDEPAVAALEARLLEDAGLAVAVAPDGGAALATLGRQRPDLVVLDLALPVASGFCVLEVLKGDPATAAVPVLVVTALDFTEAQEVAQAGADGFLTKPFEATEFVARATRLLTGAAPALASEARRPVGGDRTVSPPGGPLSPRPLCVAHSGRD